MANARRKTKWAHIFDAHCITWPYYLVTMVTTVFTWPIMYSPGRVHYTWIQPCIVSNVIASHDYYNHHLIINDSNHCVDLHVRDIHGIILLHAYAWGWWGDTYSMIAIIFSGSCPGAWRWSSASEQSAGEPCHSSVLSAAAVGLAYTYAHTPVLKY